MEKIYETVFKTIFKMSESWSIVWRPPGRQTPLSGTDFAGSGIPRPGLAVPSSPAGSQHSLLPTCGCRLLSLFYKLRSQSVYPGSLSMVWVSNPMLF